MPFLFRLFAALPLWLLHGLGAVLGWLTFATSPTYRRRFVANARQAGYRFADVKKAVAHAGRMVAEVPRLWFGAPLPCDIHGAEVIEQALADGKGIVFLTPHMGCFELSAQYMARRWGVVHGPITVLYRPARQTWLAKLMETARARPGLASAPTTMAGVRQMIKALRQGHSVGLLPDQVPPDGQGMWVPFFGKPAYSMTLAAKLAQQTGAAVILARCVRRPLGRGFDLYVRGLQAPLAQEAEAAVLQINQEMERLIRESPEQYLWGYARYKQPRSQAAAPSEGQKHG